MAADSQSCQTLTVSDSDTPRTGSTSVTIPDSSPSNASTVHAVQTQAACSVKMRWPLVVVVVVVVMVAMVAVAVVAMVMVWMAANMASKRANADADIHHRAIQMLLEDIKESILEPEREFQAEEEEKTPDEENEMLEEQVQDEEAEGLPEEQSPPKIADPCQKMYCSAGRMCVVKDAGVGECACVKDCRPEGDPHLRVCSNSNQTWLSECELHRQRCLCQEEDDYCLTPKYKYVHIEYHGPCRADRLL